MQWNLYSIVTSTDEVVHRVHQKVSQKFYDCNFKIVCKFPSNLARSISDKCLTRVRSESSCSAASTVELHGTLYITVYRSPMWGHGSTSVQLVDVFWSYRVTVSARTAAGLLLWPHGPTV